jgi:probable rRNA maturation factor
LIEIQILIPECDKRVAGKLKSAAHKTLEIASGDTEYGLTITIGSDDFVHDLNKTYRNVDRPTDVLSFSEEYQIPGTESIYLGDIAISYPTADAQSREAGHSVQDELVLLSVHGVLHLLGYDHQDELDKREMWKIQSQVLVALGISMQHFSGDE